VEILWIEVTYHGCENNGNIPSLISNSLSFPKEDRGHYQCNLGRLKKRRNLLRKYIGDDISLELQALFAVQALFVQLEHPPGTSLKTCLSTILLVPFDSLGFNLLYNVIEIVIQD